MDRAETTPSVTETLADSNILEKLDEYQALTHQYDRCALLQEKIENHRQSTRPNIYEKVKKEYETKCSELEENRKELSEILENHLKTLLEERNELNDFCQEKTTVLEEMDFRVLVGDKKEEECVEERDEIKSKLLEFTQELGRIEEFLEKYAEAGLFNNDQPLGFTTDQKSTAQDSKSERDEEKTDEEKETAAGSASEEDKAVEMDAALENPKTDEKQEEENREEWTASQAQEGFTVVEEEEDTEDADCPVVQYPKNLEERDSSDQESKEVSSDFVTGYLVALEGSRKGERFPLISSNITLGNSPGIDIRLSDPGIANFHARIQYKDRKHYLENLDNMGRSFVNAVQVDLIELKDNDVVRLGDIKFQVEYAKATRR